MRERRKPETDLSLLDHVAAKQLASLVERIERLEEERKSIADDIAKVYGEAKANGFDKAALKAVIGMRRKDQSERQEYEAIVEVYKQALGMMPCAPKMQSRRRLKCGCRCRRLQTSFF